MLPRYLDYRCGGTVPVEEINQKFGMTVWQLTCPCVQFKLCKLFASTNFFTGS